MSSMRNNGIKHLGAKSLKPAIGSSTPSKTGNTARKIPNHVRTHTNQYASLQDELSRYIGPLMDGLRITLGCVRSGVGSYLGAYREFGVGIARLSSQGVRNLIQRGVSLFRSEASSTEDLQYEADVQSSNGSKPGTNSSSSGKTNAGNNSSSNGTRNSQPAKLPRTKRVYLTINLAKIQNLSPREVAQIIISELDSQCVEFNHDSRAYALLRSVAGRWFFKEHFNFGLFRCSGCP